MIEVRFTTDVIPSYLTTKDGQQVGLDISHNQRNKDSHICPFNFNCVQSSVYDVLAECNYNKQNTLAFENVFQGGAPVIKKKIIKKIERKERSPHINYRSQPTNRNMIEITKIGTILLNDIIDHYPYVYQSDNINDVKLIEIIHQILKEKSIIINSLEFDLIVRYLRDNIFNVIKSKVFTKHPLLESIKNYDYLTPKIRFNVCDNGINNFNYKQKIAITKAMSYEWNNLSDLFVYSNRRVTFKCNLIHPLFMILYSVKFPGFEDLSILQDYSTVVEELKNNDFNKENLMLLFLRASDPNLLPSKNINHMSTNNNEMLRINISMLLRELSFSIRSGNFETKVSDMLVTLLQEIKIPNTKFEEENMLHAILATFSFKPTLISKPTINPLITSFQNSGSYMNMNMNMNKYNIPKSVYTIEYPLLDFYSFVQNETPTFTESNFNYMGYDSTTKKIIFVYNSMGNNNPYGRQAQTPEDMITSLYNYAHLQKVETGINDILPTLITRSGQLDAIYKNMTPVNILLSNGMFVLSIPREQNRYNTCSQQNLFFKQSIKPTINLSPVLFEQRVVLNRITYHLMAALCYDILDHNDGYNPILSFVDASNKIGTYAIIKVDENKWIEYNSNDLIITSRMHTRIERALRNGYTHYNIDNIVNNGGVYDPAAFELFKNSQEGKNIIKDIIDNKITLNDMIIEETRAMEKISTHGCLLFYSENYDEYRSRVEDRLLRM